MEIPPKIGKYHVIEKLGEGASGCVLKVEQEIIRRVVAMKVLFSHLIESRPSIIRRFRREAKLAASLIHPNIVPIFEIGEADGLHYYTMQYVAGTSLNKYVQAGTLSFGQKLDICVELCDALGLAHSRNIIHRDLKPQNVIVTPDMHPVILDFGIAKSLIAEDDQLTQTGHILGSAHYMAPEQAGAGDQVGTYTDVFGLGVMIYEMITGKKPFPGNNVMELIYDRLQYLQNPEAYAPLAMRQLDASVPEELDRIVFRCIEAHFEKRYPSANELLVDIQTFYRELLFKQALAQEKKIQEKVEQPINARKSYYYPALLASTILLLMAGMGVGVLKWEVQGPLAPYLVRLKNLQQEGAQKFQTLYQKLHKPAAQEK